MSRRQKTVIYPIFALAIFLSTNVSPAASESAQEPLSERELLVPYLLAGGVEVEQLEGGITELQTALDRVEKQLRGRPGYRHARRLHRVLHRDWLHTYESDADNLLQIPRDQRFNCLSATVFYGLVASRLGYRVEILEIPGHLMLRLGFGDREIDIETTSPDGFDSYQHLATLNRLGPLLDRQGSAAANASGPYGNAGAGFVAAGLDRSAAFAWLNAAWRALERSESAGIRRGVLEASNLFPELVLNADGVRTLLASAFHGAYEAGQFADALEISLLELSLFPTRTSSRERLIAAVVKRAEFLCEGDHPLEAIALMQDATLQLGQGADLRQLMRRVFPLIAVSATRIENAVAALAAVDSYSEAEPDENEILRLRRWVETRLHLSTRLSLGICLDPYSVRGRAAESAAVPEAGPFDVAGGN